MWQAKTSADINRKTGGNWNRKIGLLIGCQYNGRIMQLELYALWTPVDASLSYGCLELP